MRTSLVRAVICALALLLWAAAPAWAAPTKLESDPDEGAVLHRAPERVSVTFSEPLQDSSGLKVTDACGRRVDDGRTTIGGTASNEISIGVVRGPRGAYTVAYVATGVSGTATGNYRFAVHMGPSCDRSGGGGHGGHGGGGGGGKDGGGKDGGGKDGGGKHDGHDDGGRQGGSGDGGTHNDGHSGGTTTTHSGGDRDDHGAMGRGKHRDHDKRRGKHGGKHRDHRNGSNNEGADQDGAGAVATGPGDPPYDVPTSGTVVMALGLAIALGMLGGWVLRVSSPS